MRNMYCSQKVITWLMMINDEADGVLEEPFTT